MSLSEHSFVPGFRGAGVRGGEREGLAGEGDVPVRGGFEMRYMATQPL